MLIQLRISRGVRFVPAFDGCYLSPANWTFDFRGFKVQLFVAIGDTARLWVDMHNEGAAAMRRDKASREL